MSAADERASLARSIEHWTPALVRKYEESAYDYMVAMATALSTQTVEGEVEREYLLRVPGEPPSGAVRKTREEILDDKKYVEARWGKREAVERTIGPWIEVQS